ncbi:MAG: hypothetical protein FWH36_02815 [Lentimicrobiaceae bacterium]|nr:hypothetical protein [Lentimicrobiaceae bacterium]
MKKISYIFAIIFLLTNHSFSSNIEEENSDTQGINQKFMLKGFNCGVDIYLREDFSFVNYSYGFGCVGGCKVKIVLGEYKIEDNRISFNPKKMILKEAWARIDCFTNFDTVVYYYSDSTKIQLNYWHIKKDSFEFLVSEASFNELDEFFPRSSNFISFANLYNSNTEENICLSLFCTIDTVINIRNIISKENIPEKFQKLFFDNPIEITIKNVKINKGQYATYLLTSDKMNDIFVGMDFYSEKYPYLITIIEKKEDILIAAVSDDFFYQDAMFQIESKPRNKPKLKVGTILKSESCETNE